MTTATQNKTRVMIVDDHPIVREGYARLIDQHADLEVSAQVGTKSEAMQQILAEAPDLVIVDVVLKDGSGLELIKDMRAFSDEIKILVVSVHEESQFAERAVRAGALGYVNKQQATEQLINAIRRVLNGKVYLSPTMTDRMLYRTVGSSGRNNESPMETLSDRELEVFELIGEGETTRNIAEKLHLSPKTVETYRENIKHKLSLRNATELTQQAVRWVLENK